MRAGSPEACHAGWLLDKGAAADYHFLRLLGRDASMARKCIIVSGGEYYPVSQPDPDAFVIACDSGYESCLRSGINPDLVIGDFDSYAGRIAEGIPVLRLPCEKDDTDTMSALRWAVDKGFEEVQLYCALGGRLDHVMANLQALGWAAEHGLFAAIESPDCRVFALRGAVLRLPRREGFSLSVFALTDRCRITIRGAKYPLEDVEIGNRFPIGVSNEWAADEAVVIAHEGTLLIVESKL